MTDSPRTVSADLVVDVNPTRPKPVAWCIGALAVIALSAAIAINLPERVKLLGLFPLIWAGFLGTALHWWADENFVSVRGWPTLLTGLLIAAGEVGIVLGGWMLYRAELQRQFDATPEMSFETAVVAQRDAGSRTKMPAQPLKSDVSEQQELGLSAEIQERRAVLMQLPTFLFRRLQRVGELASPYPEIFWACEILLGTAVGVWCFQRVSLSRPTAQ